MKNRKRASAVITEVLLLVFAAFLGVSVGFSAWAITGAAENGSTQGNVDADHRIATFSGITVSLEGEPVMGHYFFIGPNGNSAETGDLSYRFAFEYGEIDQSLIHDGKLSFAGSLSIAGNLSIFGTEYCEGAYLDGDSISVSGSETSTSLPFSFSLPVSAGCEDAILSFRFKNALINEYTGNVVGKSFILRIGVQG